MLVPRSLSRSKIIVLLTLLAGAVGVGAYLLVVNLGGSVAQLPTLPTTNAQFGGTIDNRLMLPDPTEVADPSLFDDVVTTHLQYDNSILPVRGGTLNNPNLFAPLPFSLVKKK